MTKSLFYIISAKLAVKEMYLIGVHNGRKSKLTNRLDDALIDTEFHLSLRRNNCDDIADQIREQLSEYRVKRDDGSYSDWFECDLDKILSVIGDKFNH